MLNDIVINDVTGDFVDATAIRAVMSTETVAGETTAQGSLIYLNGQDDVFVSPLTPKEIFQRKTDLIGKALFKKEAA